MTFSKGTTNKHNRKIIKALYYALTPNTPPNSRTIYWKCSALGPTIVNQHKPTPKRVRFNWAAKKPECCTTDSEEPPTIETNLPNEPLPITEEPQPESSVNLPLIPNLPTMCALLTELPRQLPVIVPEKKNCWTRDTTHSNLKNTAYSATQKIFACRLQNASGRSHSQETAGKPTWQTECHPITLRPIARTW